MSAGLDREDARIQGISPRDLFCQNCLRSPVIASPPLHIPQQLKLNQLFPFVFLKLHEVAPVYTFFDPPLRLVVNGMQWSFG